VSFESKLSKFGKLLDTARGRCSSFVDFTEKSRKQKGAAVHHVGASPYSVLLFDSFIAFLSVFLSIHLRIGMDFLDYSPSYMLKNMLVFGLVSASVFLWLQTYQSFWRYTSAEDVIPVVLSVVVSNIIFFPLMMLMNQEDFLPYSVLAINTFVLSLTLLIPRFTARVLYSHKVEKMKKIEAMTKIEEKPSTIPQILLIGCSASVDMFLGEISANEDLQFNFEPVGILSMDQDEVGRAVKGVPIIGHVRQLGGVIRELAQENVFPRQIFITERSISDNMKRFLMSCVRNHGLLLMHVMHGYTFSNVTE
jgi:FlaA1/EpsC-like NDP-sugar epimerase